MFRMEEKEQQDIIIVQDKKDEKKSIGKASEGTSQATASEDATNDQNWGSKERFHSGGYVSYIRHVVLHANP